jgi:hypothetical protein
MLMPGAARSTHRPYDEKEVKVFDSSMAATVVAATTAEGVVVQESVWELPAATTTGI